MILAIQSDLEKRFEHQDMSKLHIGTALTTAQQEEWLILLRNNSPKSAVFYSPLFVSIFFWVWYQHPHNMYPVRSSFPELDSSPFRNDS